MNDAKEQTYIEVIIKNPSVLIPFVIGIFSGVISVNGNNTYSYSISCIIFASSLMAAGFIGALEGREFNGTFASIISRIVRSILAMGFGLIAVAAILYGMLTILVGTLAAASYAFHNAQLLIVFMSGAIGDVAVIFLISIISCVFSYGMYTMRSKMRTAYGKLEVVFGTFAIVYAIRDVVNNVLSAAIHLSLPDESKIDLRYIIIQFFGGVYIIVRGLSNIEDGVGAGYLPLRSLLAIIRDDLNLKSLRKKS